MALVVPAAQGEVITVGNVRVRFHVEGDKVRMVIDDLRVGQSVHVAGLETQVLSRRTGGGFRLHVTGPREIPVRATGVLVRAEDEVGGRT